MYYLLYTYRIGGGRSLNKAMQLTPSGRGEVTAYGSPVEQHTATRRPAAAHYRRRGTGAPARGRPVPAVGRPPGPGGGRRWLGQLDVPPRLRNVGAFAQRGRVRIGGREGA